MSPEDEVTYLQRLCGPAADPVEPQGTSPGQAARDARAAHVDPGPRGRRWNDRQTSGG